ncbi:MAG: periplasmic nitrate reductase, NapE protein [Burkholderiaceae bacterium]
MSQSSATLDTSTASPEQQAQPTKSEERRVLAFVLIFLAPILVTALVGGYGFVIWMMQLIYGPPTV